MKFSGERVVPSDMFAFKDTTDAYNKAYTYLEHLRRYIFAQKFCKGKSVLDAACGCGYGTAILGEVANYASGLDISKEVIKYANKNYRKNINFNSKNLENGLGDVKLKTKDVIVSFETIEHLNNPHNFLKDCSECCDTFIFSLPLNNKSKFHKQVYNLKEAQNLIKKHFVDWKIDWYEQKLAEINPLTSEARFLIGVAKK